MDEVAYGNYTDAILKPSGYECEPTRFKEQTI